VHWETAAVKDDQSLLQRLTFIIHDLELQLKVRWRYKGKASGHSWKLRVEGSEMHQPVISFHYHRRICAHLQFEPSLQRCAYHNYIAETASPVRRQRNRSNWLNAVQNFNIRHRAKCGRHHIGSRWMQTSTRSNRNEVFDTPGRNLSVLCLGFCTLVTGSFHVI
jgi:hypothetical protein